MLTKGVPQEETDSAFGVISVEGSFNLDASFAGDDVSDVGAKGTLIVAGEEEEDGNSDLSLPESVFLPSEITSLLEHKRLPPALEVEGRGAAENCVRHRGYNFFTQWALLVLLSFMLLMTSFALWIYIMNARNEIRQLNQMLQSQQSILPLALLLNHQRRALNRRISLLEQQIDRQSSKSSSSTFEGDGISNDTSVMLENCFFKASLTPGTCYKDWQSWFNEYQHKDLEAFAINLFESMRTKSSQSYDFVEAGFKNMTFEGIESLRNALGGIHLESQDRNESYVDLYESLVNVTNFAISAAVDGGAKVTRMLEKHVHGSLSGALNYSSSLLTNMLELVSDDEYLE
ncbi:hypothetical protein HJC23_010328 [Cyclotella cryptica]|uniref:Uncharacterized protein n=1 Tax=Cyclotella cryptica TaxID=29204 RepID=A0ABD3QNK4_9STRA|eukprot:CCRYP_003732-RA/>CCRYP_003732-RA protein AED:0.12 eAED:0.12 QI:0/-1/0/1/-1/1/1/0/344